MDCTQQLGNYIAETRPAEEIGYLGILGEVHAIKMGPNKIGRDPSFCDIIIDKPSLSRQHAVINVLSETQFMLMDLGSVNKTKVGVKVLQPYLPHPLSNGDTVQFGDVFGIFRLFQLPDTQVELDIPETPICTKVVSRFAQPATVPESPDVSDKEGSFIASSQPLEHDNLLIRNAVRQKERSRGEIINCTKENNFKVPAVETVNDSVFWNASTKSPSINFNLDDSETNFDISKRSSVDLKESFSKASGKKSSLALTHSDNLEISIKNNVKCAKEELNMQELVGPRNNDKHLAIHEVETQNEFEISCYKASSANKREFTANIHDQATQLDFFDTKTKITQSGTESEVTVKENNIFEAETQLFADQVTLILDDVDESRNESVHNVSKKVEDKANVTKDTSSVDHTSESDDEILFNEFESQGFDPFQPELQESQSLIDQETQIELSDKKNGTISPILSIRSPLKTNLSESKVTASASKINSYKDGAKSQDSDGSTDCDEDDDDDVVVKKRTKQINVLVESDEDLTDCEGNEVIINDAKILGLMDKPHTPAQNVASSIVSDLPKNNNLMEDKSIVEALTQVLPVNAVQNLTKTSKLVDTATENLADACTQVLPVEKPSETTTDDDFANAPTQQITPNNKEKVSTKIISVEKLNKDFKISSAGESGNIHDFKKPLLSTPLKLKRTTGLLSKESSPNTILMKGFTPLKSSPSKHLNDLNKFYEATQELLDDLSSQKENCEANIDDSKSKDISEDITQKLYTEPQNSTIIKKSAPYYDTTQDVLADMLTQQLPEDTCVGIPESGTEVESQDEDLMQLTRCTTPQGVVRVNLRNTHKMLENIVTHEDDMVPSSQDDNEDIERYPHISKELPVILCTNQEKEVYLDTSRSSSDGMETANKYVNSLTTQQVCEVVGDFEGPNSVKSSYLQKNIMKTPKKRQGFDSDTSDLEITPQKRRSLFDIELPNSEEIKTSVELKKPNRTVLESSSDSDTGVEEEKDILTPVVHRRKVPSKRKTESKEPDLSNIVGFPKRVLTRTRRATEKLNENAELKEIITRKEFRSIHKKEKLDDIPVDVIAENIEKLKSRKHSKQAKVNKEIKKRSIGKTESKLMKDDQIEAGNENNKKNVNKTTEDKVVKMIEKESDTKKGKNTKSKVEKHFEIEEKVATSSSTKIWEKRTTRHKKNEECSSKILNDDEIVSNRKEMEDKKEDKGKKRHRSPRMRSKEIKESTSSELKTQPSAKNKTEVGNEVTVLMTDVSKIKNNENVADKNKNRSMANDDMKKTQEIELKSILRNSSSDTKSNKIHIETSGDGLKMRFSARNKNSEIIKSKLSSSHSDDSTDTKKAKAPIAKTLRMRESRSTKKDIIQQESKDSDVGDQSTVFETTITKCAGKSTQRNRKRVAEEQVSTVNTPKRTRSGNLDVSSNVARSGTPSRLSLRQKHSILFTAFSNEKMMIAIKKLGASVVTDALSCTVVVTEKVKRTFKLLCAVGLGRPIVGQIWLQACVDAGALVDPWLYILEDEEVESRYKFKLSTTLAGTRNFLAGYSISATPSVLPAATEMKQIVECSGGRWGESHTSSGRWFCITCVADRQLWPSLRRRGAVLVTSELVLGGVLTQQLNVKGCKIPDA